jgi:hypothetical protein
MILRYGFSLTDEHGSEKYKRISIMANEYWY